MFLPSSLFLYPFKTTAMRSEVSFSSFALLLTILFTQSATAQTRTVTTNPETWSTLVSPGGSCNNCTINIPPGYTLILESGGSCNGCNFVGGTVNVATTFTFGTSAVTFSSDTVLINAAITPRNLNFVNDSVAVNATVTYSAGGTSITNTRMSVNANITMVSGTLSGDSIHINTPDILRFSSTSAISNIDNSNISLASNATLRANNIDYTNSVVASNGGKLIVGQSVTTDASAFYLAGASIYTINGTGDFDNGSNIVESNTAQVTVSSTLFLENSNLSVSDNAKLTVSSVFDQTGGMFTASGNSITMFNSSASFTDASVAMSGASTMHASSDITLTSDAGSPATLLMGGNASIASDGDIDLHDAVAQLNDNTSLEANSITLEQGANLFIGDGSLSSTAHITPSNGLTVSDASLIKIANGNNYLETGAPDFSTDVADYPIANNNIACNFGTVTGYPNNCVDGRVFGCSTLNSLGAVGCVVLAQTNLELKAYAASSNSVDLSWSDDDLMVQRYSIQRASGNNQWSTIGSVKAESGSSEYRFTDGDAPAGTVNYRIERTDVSGEKSYSPVSSVKLLRAEGKINVYPNLVVGGKFYITTPDSRAVIASIFTMTGQLLSRTVLQGQTQYTMHLQATSLQAVVVQVIGQGRSSTFTLLVR